MTYIHTLIAVLIMGLTAVSAWSQAATNTEILQVQNGNEIRLYELGTNGTNYTSFKAAGSMSGDIKYTMPSAAPTVNQVLSATAVSGSDVTLGWANSSSSSNGNLLAVNLTQDDNGGPGFLDATELSIAVSANKNYFFTVYLICRTGNQNSDPQIQFVVPTGTTMSYVAERVAGSVLGAATSGIETTITTININGDNQDAFARFQGVIRVGGTAGDVKIQFQRSGGNTVSIMPNSAFIASTN